MGGGAGRGRRGHGPLAVLRAPATAPCGGDVPGWPPGSPAVDGVHRRRRGRACAIPATAVGGCHCRQPSPACPCPDAATVEVADGPTSMTRTVAYIARRGMAVTLVAPRPRRSFVHDWGASRVVGCPPAAKVRSLRPSPRLGAWLASGGGTGGCGTQLPSHRNAGGHTAYRRMPLHRPVPRVAARPACVPWVGATAARWRCSAGDDAAGGFHSGGAPALSISATLSARGCLQRNQRWHGAAPIVHGETDGSFHTALSLCTHTPTTPSCPPPHSPAASVQRHASRTACSAAAPPAP